MGKKANKQSATRGFVKTAARDLGLTYQKGMGVGEIIRAEADRMLRQSGASSGVDPDEGRWRGLYHSRRDLTPIDQDRLIDIAYYLAFQNPLGSRIHQITRDFVIGEGCTIEAEDKDIIQPILDEFWNDPVNNMDEFQFELVDFLGVTGELLLPTYVAQTTGQTRLGWVDPVEVQWVIRDLMNRRIMQRVVMKPKPIALAGYADVFGDYFSDQSWKSVYTVSNIDTDMHSDMFGLRNGDLLFYRINCAPDGTRGRSDYEPVADMLDAYDQATFTALERAGFLMSFIWDVKLTGMSEPEIDKWLTKQQSPKPGSIRAHNENAEWSAETPSLQSADLSELVKTIRQQVLGSRGLSDFFFGITEGSNRASSENLELPLVKGLASRQRKVKAVFRDMCDYAIDQAIYAKPLLRRRIIDGTIKRGFEVNMPEISIRDLSKIATMIAPMTAALDWAESKQIIKKETEARVFSTLIAQMGIEYDPTQEMEEAEAAAEEAAAIGAPDYATPAGKQIADGMATKLDTAAAA